MRLTSWVSYVGLSCSVGLVSVLASDIAFSQSRDEPSRNAIETSRTSALNNEEPPIRIVDGMKEFPANINVDFGDVPQKELSIRWVEIKNNSQETFQAQSSNTDCGCAVGYVEKALTKPSDFIRVRVRIIPTAPGNFKRTISILGEDGSNRSLRLNVTAKVKPRFIVTPSSLTIDHAKREHLQVAITSNFEKFEVGTTLVAQDSLFIPKLISATPETLTIQLNPTYNANTLKEIYSDTMRVTFQLESENSAPRMVEIPTFATKPPAIKPSNFTLSSELTNIKFFIVGDFNFPIETLRHAKVHIVFQSGDKELVSSDWKNQRVCVCSANIPLEKGGHSNPSNACVEIQFDDQKATTIGSISLIK